MMTPQRISSQLVATFAACLMITSVNHLAGASSRLTKPEGIVSVNEHPGTGSYFLKYLAPSSKDLLDRKEGKRTAPKLSLVTPTANTSALITPEAPVTGSSNYDDSIANIGGGQHQHQHTIECNGNGYPHTFEWICEGITVIKVPSGLTPKPTILRLAGTGIETLTSSLSTNYRETLQDFSMQSAPELSYVEPGTFAEMSKLRVVYILQAPKLLAFDNAFFGKYPNIWTLRIQQSGLRSWPNLAKIKLENQEKILTSVELNHNEVTNLGLSPVNIRTETLNLEYNYFASIGEFTLNGSEIGVLTLAGNRQLTYIHPKAFVNVRSLYKLDLSETSIAHMPDVGLEELRTLIVHNNHLLKEIPSIGNFPQLERAELTYGHHCCSFMRPQKHDPSTREKYIRMQTELDESCARKRFAQLAVLTVSSPSLEQGGHPVAASADLDWEGIYELEPQNFVIGVQQEQEVPAVADVRKHQIGATLNESKLHSFTVDCGQLTELPPNRNISCVPEPDPYNPCEDIISYPVLRVAVWLVVATSMFGNLSVIVTQICAALSRRLSVPGFLQLNLAIGDLFMSFYLLMLAAADLYTMGRYFDYALQWQHGYGCMISGGFSLFASQLSVFSLVLITIERYYTLNNSLDRNKRLKMGLAVRLMIVGWIYAFACAILPIFADVNSYSKTSICLPLRTNQVADRVYLGVLLVNITCAFLVIVVCYLKTFLTIIREQTEASKKQLYIAKNMTTLVLFDFCCWAPIIFFGTTALAGVPLIGVSASKFIIILFYPLNAMANPYLYACWKSYKNTGDFYFFGVRWKCWRRKAKSINYYNAPDLFYASNSTEAIMSLCQRTTTTTTGDSMDCRCGTRGSRSSDTTAPSPSQFVCTQIAPDDGQGFEVNHRIVAAKHGAERTYHGTRYPGQQDKLHPPLGIKEPLRQVKSLPMFDKSRTLRWNMKQDGKCLGQRFNFDQPSRQSSISMLERASCVAKKCLGCGGWITLMDSVQDPQLSPRSPDGPDSLYSSDTSSSQDLQKPVRTSSKTSDRCQQQVEEPCRSRSKKWSRCHSRNSYTAGTDSENRNHDSNRRPIKCRPKSLSWSGSQPSHCELHHTRQNHFRFHRDSFSIYCPVEVSTANDFFMNATESNGAAPKPGSILKHRATGDPVPMPICCRISNSNSSPMLRIPTSDSSDNANQTSNKRVSFKLDGCYQHSDEQHP